MVTHIIPIAFHSKQIYHPIKKYGGEKIIFILSNPKDSKCEQRITDTLKNAKKIAALLGVKCESVTLRNDFDVNERISTFEKLFEKNEDIILNITGGPKFDSLLLYIIANKYQRKVKDIIYIREDIEEIIKLPFIFTNQKTTDFELQIINYLTKPRTTNQLSRLTGKNIAQISRYVKQLEKKGIVETKKENGNRVVKLSKFFLL